MKYTIQVVIAVLGLSSFASMFIGTALGIIFFGFDMGARIFAASILILFFCVAYQKAFIDKE